MPAGDIYPDGEAGHGRADVAPSSWRVVAASVAGSAHRWREQPCQDAHAWAVLPGGVLIVAIADGAGSAALGEVGARVAVQVALGAACRAAGSEPSTGDDEWPALLLGAAAEARQAVEVEAAARDAASRELAATLILVAAMPGLVAVVQVGDGAAVAGDASGKVISLTVPRSGEYINETVFLTSPGAVEDAQASLWRGDVAQVAAFTDGLQMLALQMPAAAPHPPFFGPLFRFVASAGDLAEAERQLVAFLTSRRVAGRTDDDLTLVLASLEGDGDR